MSKSAGLVSDPAPARLKQFGGHAVARSASALFGAALLTAGSVIALPGSTDAADLAPNYFPAPQRFFTFNWTGPYVGATLGYEWGSVDNNPTHPSGVAGGLEAGLNWQNGNFV